MSAPDSHPARNARVATAHALRQAHLNPYDVIVLAAVEAVNQEPGRQALASTGEVATAARLSGQATLACLEHHLAPQRLVERLPGLNENDWRVTRLGREVLAELIRKEHKGRPRVY